jgi:hypothetical protein
MMYYRPFGLIYGEAFQTMGAKTVDLSGAMPSATPAVAAPTPTPTPAEPAAAATTPAEMKKEGFTSYALANGAGAKDKYEPIGPFDGVKLSTGNSSNWRYTAPNEPLMGPAFAPGPDNLFIFKNNQCKPECCGASFACDGGCVCTTPQQRDFINQRGGNRTLPEDGV